MKYKFSIVIPSYNNLPLLKQAVDSVRIQKNVSWELIVVDDSDTNEVEDYMSSFEGNNIKYVHNNPSLGAVRNWNFGLSKVEGEYVVLLHHDESFISERHLLCIVKTMEKGADIVIAPTYVYSNGTLYKKTRPNLCHYIFLHYPSLLFMTNQIGPCASVAFKKCDIQNFNDKLHWLVDVEWYYRMLKEKKICVLDEKFHIQSMHNHAGQITCSMDVGKELDKDVGLIKSIYKCNMSIHLMLNVNRFIRNSSKVRVLLRKLFNKQ